MAEPSASILVVGVTGSDGETLAGHLASASAECRRVVSTEDADRALEDGAFDAVLIDLSLDGATTLMKDVAARFPDLPLIAITEQGKAAQGVEAVQNGAADFVRKPFEAEEVSYVVGKAFTAHQAAADAPPPSMLMPQTTIIGRSEAISDVLNTVRRAANGIATVLIRGESGTGKELIARQVHELSPRRAGPFVKVHCGALPDNLLESELFGYEKGAFTGATARKPGRVELADGGTLFLDEIGDITPAVQVKLLRVLQDKEFERLGGTESHKADVRFVAATHRDLDAMVAKGEFREDLFYRLNVVPIVSPPLRARAGDIDELAKHFCDAVAAANGRPPVTLDADAIDLLRAQKWPGNVRQLQNFIERLVVLIEGTRIAKTDVERQLKTQAGALGFAIAEGYGPEATGDSEVIGLDAAIKKAEKRALEKALRKAGGNRNVAARILGVSRRTLYYKLQQHGVS